MVIMDIIITMKMATIDRLILIDQELFIAHRSPTVLVVSKFVLVRYFRQLNDFV